MYSLLGLRFYLQDFFSLGQFLTTFMPHTGGGGGGCLNKQYLSGTEQQFERKKDTILSCLKLHFIMSH